MYYFGRTVEALLSRFGKVRGLCRASSPAGPNMNSSHKTPTPIFGTGPGESMVSWVWQAPCGPEYRSEPWGP